jgi:hypothetical protein
MVIGNVNENDLARTIFKVQKESKKEINFILWNTIDLNQKMKDNNQFLKNISKNPKIWIRGDGNEFIRIVEKGFNKAS